MDLTKTSFEKFIDDKTPSIIDFYADWCGPCRMMAPVFEELGREYAGKLKFAKVNTENEPEIASGHNVMGIPCMILFRAGKEIGRIVGYMSKEELKARISSII